MTSPDDSINQNLSFTRDNRHQYLETAMVSPAESEQEITQAEARGRERRVREAVQRRRMQSIGLVMVGLLFIGGVAALVFWVSR